MPRIVRNSLEVVEGGNAFYVYGRDKHGEEIYIGVYGLEAPPNDHNINTDSDFIDAWNVTFEPTLYIRDDSGHAWSFDGTRVYRISAELELMETGEEKENGYSCKSWEEAIEILNRDDYITGFDEE